MAKKPYTRVAKGDLKGALIKIQNYQLRGETYNMKQVCKEFHIGATKRELIPDMRNAEVTDAYAAEVQRRITAHIRKSGNKPKTNARVSAPELDFGEARGSLLVEKGLKYQEPKTGSVDTIAELVERAKSMGAKQITIIF